VRRAIGLGCLGALLTLAGCGGSGHVSLKKAEEELSMLCPHGVLIEPHGDECIGASHASGTLGASRIKLLEGEITKLCAKEAAAAACGLHKGRPSISG
jgi:hypothetical protein